MKDNKFGAPALATIFVSAFGFCLVVLHYIKKQILATDTGSNPFLDDPIIENMHYFMALILALSVTNIVSKVRNNKKSKVEGKNEDH
ncbi:hypothetical protein IB292_03270 [Vibrio parahaemolyticus]|uniref:Uncharacterized protein n=1 Tax=Vibrio parahaemolyticus TaxID=670 RepID=A0A9Q3U9Z9_VIBPH|nr:hypothetical protein [Vibrio parahaemolyticus]MCC3804053.1 hypothetical protein [Vibrio parahaemolyticus]